MSQNVELDVLIVEDEAHLAEIHKEYLENNFNLRVIGVATSIAQAKNLIERFEPKLILLDNYLPDGQGIELINSPLLKSKNCSVIFVTAASEMKICSQAMRSGAFDYILKPVSFSRLRSSIEKYMKLNEKLRYMKNAEQTDLDWLFHLPGGKGDSEGSVKVKRGIDQDLLTLVKEFFLDNPDENFWVDDVMDVMKVSKTTTRRYLEHCVELGFLEVKLLYGRVGHPRRVYRLIPPVEQIDDGSGSDT